MLGSKTTGVDHRPNWGSNAKRGASGRWREAGVPFFTHALLLGSVEVILVELYEI